MMGILLTFLLFLALLVVFFLPGVVSGATSQSINFDQPTKDWYAGPVRYIITHQEVKAYKALDSDLDRANFIDWFWQRRDINPDTPENEFRDRFEQRVYEATRMFNDTSKPGWKTDMGKVYILVGPPDEMNKDLMGKTHRGIVTWVYRRPPFPDLPTNTVIGFARDMSGEFRISVSPTLDSDVARGLQFQKVMRTADDQIMFPGRDPALLAAGAPLSQGVLDTMMMFGRLQQLPPGEEALFRTMVTAREFFGAIPADSRFDFYRAPEGTTYTTVTIGIKSSSVQYKQQGDREVPDVGVFGKLINKDDPDQVYPLASDSAFVEGRENETAGPGDILVFQATGAFKPGRYQLVLGVQDRVSKKIASYRKEVVVPDLSPKVLSISSVTLAGKMEPTDRVWTTGKPFYVGRFHIVPRPDGVFAKGDELNLYFQVYDPATDPGNGKPKLGVLYTFRRKKPDGSLEDVGTYEVKESSGQVQGYAVPLEKWPPGPYLVVVKVTDALASKSVVSPPAEFAIKP
jgi:GWxTD domain-containing protein